MSYYVRRVRIEDAKEGWTGPIRTLKQAEREAAAWKEAGWSAAALENTPERRQRVGEWQKQCRARSIRGFGKDWTGLQVFDIEVRKAYR